MISATMGEISAVGIIAWGIVCTAASHVTVAVVRVRELTSKAVFEKTAGVTLASPKMRIWTGRALSARPSSTSNQMRVLTSEEPGRRSGYVTELEADELVARAIGKALEVGGVEVHVAGRHVLLARVDA